MNKDVKHAIKCGIGGMAIGFVFSALTGKITIVGTIGNMIGGAIGGTIVYGLRKLTSPKSFKGKKEQEKNI